MSALGHGHPRQPRVPSLHHSRQNLLRLQQPARTYDHCYLSRTRHLHSGRVQEIWILGMMGGQTLISNQTFARTTLPFQDLISLVTSRKNRMIKKNKTNAVQGLLPKNGDPYSLSNHQRTNIAIHRHLCHFFNLTDLRSSIKVTDHMR